MVDSDLADPGYGDEPPPVGHNMPPATYEDEVRREHQAIFLRFDALKLDAQKIGIVNDDADLETAAKFMKAAAELVKAGDKAHKKGTEEIAKKKATWDTVFLTRGLKGEVGKLTAVVQALCDSFTERKAAENRRKAQADADRLRDAASNAAYAAQEYKGAGEATVAEVLTSQGEHADKAADRMEAKAAGKVADVVRTRFDGVTASGRTVWSYEVTDRAAIDLNVLREVIFDNELAPIIQRYIDRGGRDLPGVRIFEKAVATFR